MHPSLQLTKPQNQGGSNDDAYPLVERQRHHIKHFATERDNEHLAESNYQYGDTKTASYIPVEQAFKCRIHGMISLGIEDVPELHEHEDGEQ